MFLRISSRSDASRLKQSAAVVAQISGLYFTIQPFCPVNPGFLLYSELAASFFFSWTATSGAGAPREQGRLTHCPCSAVAAAAAFKGEPSSAERAAN